MVQYLEFRRIDRALAISDPTRRAILEFLTRGPERISYMARRFPMSLAGFCKHVKVPKRAGHVRRTRHGRENTLEPQAQALCEVVSMLHENLSFVSVKKACKRSRRLFKNRS